MSILQHLMSLNAECGTRVIQESIETLFECWYHSRITGKRISGFKSLQKPTCKLSFRSSNCYNRFYSVRPEAVSALDVVHVILSSANASNHRDPTSLSFLPSGLPERDSTCQLNFSPPTRRSRACFPQAKLPSLPFLLSHSCLPFNPSIAHINHGAKPTTRGFGRSVITRDKTGYV
jgi:hypothetical protein